MKIVAILPLSVAIELQTEAAVEPGTNPGAVFQSALRAKIDQAMKALGALSVAHEPAAAYPRSMYDEAMAQADAEAAAQDLARMPTVGGVQ